MTNLILLLALLAPDTPDRWPGFLGAGASPLKAESLPLKWSPSDISWTIELPGHGQSSPVIWGGLAFVSSVEGPNKETYHLLAVDVSNGKTVWKQSLQSSVPVKSSLYVSRAAPTPVTDGKAVYAFFESGDAAAFSMTGEKLWTRALTGDYGEIKSGHGLAASPLLADEAMIVLVDSDGSAYLAALSKQDGHTLWKTDRPQRISWSSPSIVRAGEHQYIVCSASGSIDGYDVRTGKLEWSVDDVGGNTVATPLPFGDGSFLVGASAGRGGENAEGAAKSNRAMQIDFTNGKAQARLLWLAEGASSSFGSPMVHAGCAYWVNRSGVVYCFDAKTGESLYTQRLGESCWATPLGVGERVYVFGKDGTTRVLKAGPKFEILAENHLWDPESVVVDEQAARNEEAGPRRQSADRFSGPVQYGIAAVNGSLLIRTGDHLYCIRP